MRERLLKIALVVVGLLFTATLYPLLQMDLEAALQMMLSVYVTLGIFLLFAARNPEGHRSLIAFAAWSSIAHAATMVLQGLRDVGERDHFWIGSALLLLLALPLILLAPAKSKASA